MHAIWVSLKENVNCGSKLRLLSDVAYRARKCSRDRSNISKDDSAERKLLRRKTNPMRKAILSQSDEQGRFWDLNVGDPSRNIIEKIFQSASTNSSKQYSRKIVRVLRVKNPLEILERFENYRELVKKKASEQYEGHPRSMVDGNELLRFYNTTVTCCGFNPNWVSQLCEEPSCGVCRTIQSSFDTEYKRKNGIRLTTTTSSEALSKTVVANSKGKNVKSAAIVCRTIAGRMVNSMIDGENEGEYDSIRSVGLCSKIEHLIVQNPSAVLPCFVIIFT